MSLNNLGRFEFDAVLSGSSLDKEKVQSLLSAIIQLTNVIEDSGVPTQAAEKHTWYFDTATNKYYRNVDGGTTWVALN